MEMQVIFFINFNESKKPLYACKVTHGISESRIDFQWGSRKYPVYFDRYAIGKPLGPSEKSKLLINVLPENKDKDLFILHIATEVLVTPGTRVSVAMASD